MHTGRISLPCELYIALGLASGHHRPSDRPSVRPSMATNGFTMGLVVGRSNIFHFPSQNGEALVHFYNNNSAISQSKKIILPLLLTHNENKKKEALFPSPETSDKIPKQHQFQLLNVRRNPIAVCQAIMSRN